MAVKRKLSDLSDLDKAALKKMEEVGTKLPLFLFRKVYLDPAVADRILVFRDKHAHEYAEAMTPESTLASFLRVLKRRFGDDGYWFKAREELALLRKQPPKKPETLEEKIDDLPKELQEAARRVWATYKSQLRDHENALHQFELMVKALDENDGESALMAMHMRRDYEYEGFDFAYLEREEEGE